MGSVNLFPYQEPAQEVLICQRGQNSPKDWYQISPSLVSEIATMNRVLPVLFLIPKVNNFYKVLAESLHTQMSPALP